MEEYKEYINKNTTVKEAKKVNEKEEEKVRKKYPLMCPPVTKY